MILFLGDSLLFLLLLLYYPFSLNPWINNYYIYSRNRSKDNYPWVICWTIHNLFLNTKKNISYTYKEMDSEIKQVLFEEETGYKAIIKGNLSAYLPEDDND